MRSAGATRARRVLAVLAALAVAVPSACADGTANGGGSAPDADGRGPTELADLVERLDETSDEDLAAEAYVAGYPLVVSVRTLQRLGDLVGVNRLFWQPGLAGPDTRTVVAPNRDTLYSIAVLDLRSEPMVLTLPEVADRYFTYQLLDTWTESFAYVGTRATGGEAGTWLIAPPGWDGEPPPGASVLRSDTPLVFLLGRFLVDDEADVAAVQAIADEVSLRPLSAVTGDEAPPPPPPLGEPAGTPQDIPADASFFDELGRALVVNPAPSPAQAELFAALEARGLAPDPGGDGEPGPAARRALDRGATRGAARIDEAMVGRSDLVDGWSDARRVGRYGDDIEQRALVARVGWGANVPEEALYPVARVDADGEALDGGSTYRIRFAPGELPPVDAFWSLSVYGPDMFFTPHPSGRYSIGDRTPGLATAADGSLEIVLSATEPPPGPDGAPVNWLPVPSGRFVLMLRLYLPRPEVLDGNWHPPPVLRTDG